MKVCACCPVNNILRAPEYACQKNTRYLLARQIEREEELKQKVKLLWKQLDKCVVKEVVWHVAQHQRDYPNSQGISKQDLLSLCPIDEGLLNDAKDELFTEVGAYFRIN